MKKIISNIKSIFKIDDTPERIARGFALGSFIGMMPIPGFQVLVALGISTIIKVNKKAACVAVFNTNIATGAFVFAFNYWLGKNLLGIKSCFTMPDKIGLNFITVIMEAGAEVFIAMTFGGLLTGIVAAFVTYFSIKRILLNKQSQHTL
ncbi:DUF2062 domain-containing protein [Halosquirtibacter xylanolyticus]|uniref:DUF2062 domain-containing protein n=1 Tax=Halosquirtibacter xylanolyticus TaxID=3374599 RepID=UPI00374799A9|nr:DUF2062 domain-containing protein [Prolixibacteraceae bacterium]